MAQFSKELSFVKEVPENMEIDCPICLNILTDPHIVSCCGHNFCGSCIERIKASNGSCPMCKEKDYLSFVDKKCSRRINGLEVYCSNKEKGCQWKGELKNMSTHRNKEKIEGECQYEEVKCRYEKCLERKQRRYLKDHEDRECDQRPFQCQYRGEEGTFLSITKDHYEECRQYPVTCPNKCVSTNMPRGSLTAHINECPLEPVDCYD
ncbi:PREDICTED: TNF receptor-associated factor 3-like [Amphimedon queenslandica]|uniref:RING-type domain-containing protein n=1 Tax=Amphimedon queenslandica TaxID=400682 RepID=A0AAN0IMT1_AMPQE|nr:PREDICTED: TNF receptor-associated factor 3-like [Amphimedon queenslandica]|eukprot:XP_011404978.1 PREDICTED: TNF receptor-associated factor 3-like [Amphimedon queenslandica]